MTELAQINEHSTEIANPENQTENIQSFSCSKPEAIYLPICGQHSTHKFFLADEEKCKCSQRFGKVNGSEPGYSWVGCYTTRQV